MAFNPDYTLGDLVQGVGLLFTAAGLAFTAVETRRATKQRRAQQVVDLQNQFYSDAALMDAYYSIEYEEFIYDVDFHGSELEKKIDRLLTYFDNVASLYEAEVLTRKQLDTFSYTFLTVYQDEEIQKYLAFLDGWYKERGLSEVPFEGFRESSALLTSTNVRRPPRSRPTSGSSRRASLRSARR